MDFLVVINSQTTKVIFNQVIIYDQCWKILNQDTFSTDFDSITQISILLNDQQTSTDRPVAGQFVLGSMADDRFPIAQSARSWPCFDRQSETPPPLPD